MSLVLRRRPLRSSIVRKGEQPEPEPFENPARLRNLHLPHSTASRTCSYIKPSLRSGHFGTHTTGEAGQRQAPYLYLARRYTLVVDVSAPPPPAADGRS